MKPNHHPETPNAALLNIQSYFPRYEYVIVTALAVQEAKAVIEQQVSKIEARLSQRLWGAKRYHYSSYGGVFTAWEGAARGLSVNYEGQFIPRDEGSFVAVKVSLPIWLLVIYGVFYAAILLTALSTGTSLQAIFTTILASAAFGLFPLAVRLHFGAQFAELLQTCLSGPGHAASAKDTT